MKNFALFTFFVFIFKLSVCQNDNDMNQTIYQFKVKDITGKTFDFENLRGKKIMIVNTASKCGLTGQYRASEAL